jgi:hypothetical protein
LEMLIEVGCVRPFIGVSVCAYVCASLIVLRFAKKKLVLKKIQH